MSHLLSFLICLLLVLFTLLLHLKFKRKQINVLRWQKLLNLQEHAQVFRQIYTDANGFMLSQNARHVHDAMEYAYGEIEFLSFIALLSLTNPNKNTVFYDLGSGTGKAVLACSMVFPICKSIGIELFPELYLDSCKRRDQLAAMKNYAEQTKKIQFILGDFLKVNLDDATLVFINSTAFFGPTWEKLCAKLDHLPHLNTVITTSKTLSSTHFTVTTRTKVEMSWGVVFAYVHTRKTTFD
ncbi:methyltransferase [Legionella bozemanae]|uniref:methyltransferase n=1 Tax=Legionella bozemanae TaxID=447 RepID=UPI00399CB62E